MTSNTTRLLVGGVVGLIGCGLPTIAASQTRASIIGSVTDSTSAALPAVTVRLLSDSLAGGPQVVATDGSGAYRFVDLPTGVYILRFELAGFRVVEQTGIRLPFGQTLTIDAVLEVASVDESVTVSGGSPVVDVTTAAAPTRIDTELLQSLPVNRAGNFGFGALSFTALVPGVAANDVAFGGNQRTTRLVEGFSINNPGGGGNVGSALGYNWIEEVSVVALGAPAEYGEFVGAGANVVLRSGSNRLSGLVDGWSTIPASVGDNRGSLSEAARTRFRPAEVLSQWQAGGQIGGPLRRDALFSFTAFEFYGDQTRPVGALGGTNKTQWPRVLQKLNWAASPALKLDGFLTWDNWRAPSLGAGPTTQPEAMFQRRTPTYKWGLRGTWTPSTTTMLEVRNGGYFLEAYVDPLPPNSRTGPAPHVDLQTGIVSVNMQGYQFTPQQRFLTSATLTQFVGSGGANSHVLKFGAELERIRVRWELGWPGDEFFEDRGSTPFQVRLWSGDRLDPKTSRVTVFGQDKWTLGERVTVEPGIRVTVNRGSVAGKGTVFETNGVEPRVGVAWDATSDHKTVVRAHYGRFQEALLTATFEVLDTEGRTPVVLARVLEDGRVEPIDQFNPTENVGGGQDLNHAYVRQLVLGAERELFPNVSVEARYINRRWNNIFAYVDRRSTYEPIDRTDPGPDGALGTADDGGTVTVFNLVNPGQAFYELTNAETAYRKYDGWQVIVSKRSSSNWQLLASYTFSKTRGNVNNTGGEAVANGGDTSIFGVFANPNRAINADGRSTFDYPQQIKVEGSYRIPRGGGLSISSVYRYTSGQAHGRLVLFTGLRQGTEAVLVEPRGSRRTPAVQTLDLRLDKTFAIGAGRPRVSVYCDVFNANNWGGPDAFSGSSGVGDAGRGASRSAVGASAVFDVSGPTFGQARAWLAPRSMVVGTRLTF